MPSLDKQLEVQKKIWDMEFWCETCNQFGKRAPILKDQLDFADGQVAGQHKHSPAGCEPAAAELPACSLQTCTIQSLSARSSACATVLHCCTVLLTAPS